MGSLMPIKDRKVEKRLRKKKDLMGESGGESIVEWIFV